MSCRVESSMVDRMRSADSRTRSRVFSSRGGRGGGAPGAPDPPALAKPGGGPDVPRGGGPVSFPSPYPGCGDGGPEVHGGTELGAYDEGLVAYGDAGADAPFPDAYTGYGTEPVAPGDGERLGGSLGFSGTR